VQEMSAVSDANAKCNVFLAVASRGRGGGGGGGGYFGVFKGPPPNSEGPPKSCQIQPECEHC